MTGIDKFQRRFLVIKFRLESNITIYQTFFEKYTHNQLHWEGVGINSSGLIWGHKELTSEQIEFINKILIGEKILITEAINPVSHSILNEYVVLASD